MLSIDERQLLQWLTAHYYSGQGAIVDGGPFVGGSTVPLAEGLLSAGRSDAIDVYDRFEVEPYMSEMYFQHDGLVGGDSFLPVFERNTAHVAELLSVHAGDLLGAVLARRPDRTPVRRLLEDVGTQRLHRR